MDSADIIGVYEEPASYDGCLQVIKRSPLGHISSAERRRAGKKVNIQTLSIQDAIWDNPNFPVDNSKCGNRADDLNEMDEKTRQEVRKCEAEIAKEPKNV